MRLLNAVLPTSIIFWLLAQSTASTTLTVGDKARDVTLPSNGGVTVHPADLSANRVTFVIGRNGTAAYTDGGDAVKILGAGEACSRLFHKVS